MLGFRVQFVLLESMTRETCILGIPKIQREVFMLNEDPAKQPLKLQVTISPAACGCFAVTVCLCQQRWAGTHCRSSWGVHTPANLPGLHHTAAVRAAPNHSPNASSNYLIALICALVRSTEHNDILALKRAKKKKGFILMF